MVRNAHPSLTHSQIQTVASHFNQSLFASTANESMHPRSHLFKASDHFITRFKLRNHLSSHRTAVVHVNQPEQDRDMELERIAFIVEARDAIDRYGSHIVFNMDETPVSLLDVLVTAVVSTGIKRAAVIETVGTRITTFPTISAGGDKLPLCAIIKGKTEKDTCRSKHDCQTSLFILFP